jgi:hypothetical protein
MHFFTCLRRASHPRRPKLFIQFNKIWKEVLTPPPDYNKFALNNKCVSAFGSPIDGLSRHRLGKLENNARRIVYGYGKSPSTQEKDNEKLLQKKNLHVTKSFTSTRRLEEGLRICKLLTKKKGMPADCFD